MTLIRNALRLAALTGAASASLAAAPAAAQENGRGWLVTVGGGPQTFAKYPGADDYGIYPMPVLGLRREGAPLPVETPDEGAGFGVLGLFGDDEVFDFGPTVAFVNRRDPDDVGAPVEEVKRSVEVGGFAHLYPAPWLRLRVEGRKAVSGHDGWNGDVAVDFVARSENSVFTIGPRARIADGRYHRAYFGVTPAAATATGLPVYTPGGGVHAIGAMAGVTHQFSPSWGMYAYAGYDRLVGDAGDSPLVHAYGSRDQFSGGIGISYTFRVGGR